MTEEKSILNNLEVHKEFVVASINPKLYPLSVIFSAAYTMLERAHIIIDGDPDTELLVELRLKNKEDNPEKLGRDFNDELVNYAVYMIQSIKNKRIREELIESALRGHTSEPRPQPAPGPGIQNRGSGPAGVTKASERQTQRNTGSAPAIQDPEGILKVRTPDDSQVNDPKNIFKDNVERK